MSKSEEVSVWCELPKPGNFVVQCGRHVVRKVASGSKWQNWQPCSANVAGREAIAIRLEANSAVPLRRCVGSERHDW